MTRALSAADRQLRTRAATAAAVIAGAGALIVFAVFQLRVARGPGPIAIAAAGYVSLGAAGMWWLHRRGELGALLRPMRGDIGMAAAVTAGLWALTKLGALALAPDGTPRQAWLIRFYDHLSWASGRPLAGIAIMWIAAFEELCWRGFVFRSLRAGFGARRAFWATTALYTLAQAPSVWLLAAERSGPNPLVLSAGLLGGAAWGVMALRSGRLAPAIFAHALYSWAVVEFPVWRL